METVGVQKTGCSVCGQNKRPEDYEQTIAYTTETNSATTSNAWIWILLVILFIAIVYVIFFRNKKLGRMTRRK
jgi:hypothetical protein